MKNKKTPMGRWATLPVLFACAISLSCCDQDEITKRRAERAAEEMCECIKTKSKSTCEKELERNFGSDTNQTFVDFFNEAQTCGISLKLEHIKK